MVDTQVQNLTALTTASDEDVLYIVDDPAGTPLSRKITKANLLKALGTPESGTLTNCTGLPLAGLSTTTASRALVSNASGVISPATTTSTEIGYVNGVTSAIQTQIDAKQAVVSGVSNTEIGYLDGVTSAIQTQIDTKVTSGGALGTPSSGTLTNCTGLPLAGLATSAKTESFIIACSDETTALTVGTGKAEFQMPYAFTVTEVFATVTTAPTGGTLLTVDINEGGTSIISTKITIDASEKTSRTAATAPVISDSSLANSGVITIDIDAIGSTIAGAGLKVYIIGYQS